MIGKKIKTILASAGLLKATIDNNPYNLFSCKLNVHPLKVSRGQENNESAPSN